MTPKNDRSMPLFKEVKRIASWLFGWVFLLVLCTENTRESYITVRRMTCEVFDTENAATGEGFFE